MGSITHKHDHRRHRDIHRPYPGDSESSSRLRAAVVQELWQRECGASAGNPGRITQDFAGIPDFLVYAHPTKYALKTSRLLLPISNLLSYLLTVIISGLFAIPAFAHSFQPILHLACPDGEFVVDARPYDGDEAGGSQVERRYRYRGIELAFINYENYYHNLIPYLHQGDPAIYHMGLELDTSGDSKTGGVYQSGDTLYLPPNRFSSIEAEHVATCLAKNQNVIHNAFKSNAIHGRTLLGLMKTRANIALGGIARIVLAEAPIAAIYGDFLRIVVVERNGRVVLLTNLVASAPADSAVWGHVVPGKRGKPVLRAKRRIVLEGKELEGKHFIVEKNARGSRLKDDFTVELE